MKLKTEDDVKKELNITDFRHITKEKVIEFASNIPDMSDEIAAKCIEQFPNFKEAAVAIVNNFYDLCKKAIEEDHEESLIAYRDVLDELKFSLAEDNLSEDMKKYIIERMIEVADKMDSTIDKKHNFKLRVLEIAGIVGSVAVGILGAAIGISSKLKK